jgi:hypothetical protein
LRWHANPIHAQSIKPGDYTFDDHFAFGWQRDFISAFKYPNITIGGNQQRPASTVATFAA